MARGKLWTEEEKNALFELIREHPLSEAYRIHAENTGRNKANISKWFEHNRRIGKIPQSIIDLTTYNYVKWSEEEIKDLLQLIAEHPNNFKEAYRIHSANTGRTVGCVAHYFQRYRKKEEAKVCMVTIGRKKHVSPNRKNIYPGTGGTVKPIRKSKWKKILEILFG